MKKTSSKKPAPTKPGKTVATLRHDAKRKNLPTAEFQSVMQDAEKTPIRLAYERRNRDLDPQLVWRGKDEQDWSDLVVTAPPLYIQEKVHPKVLIDDLLRQSKARAQATAPQIDLFGDFNGLPKDARATEFYQHDANWTNRMILGDSLQVMASLAEREGLRGKVQCIYFDPPYGIKFNSNFQWSTTSRDVKDGNAGHITREPEQVKAFRDTWRDGIHSYLTYLRDRLTVARDLLADSGSIFVQIGDENVHRVRGVMDEVFGDENFVSLTSFRTTANLIGNFLGSNSNYLLWYAKAISTLKYRQLYKPRTLADDVGLRYTRIEMPDFSRRVMTTEERNDSSQLPKAAEPYTHGDLTSQGATDSGGYAFLFHEHKFNQAHGRHWTTSFEGMSRVHAAGRMVAPSPNSLRFVRYLKDFPASELSSVWSDTATGAFTDDKVYVVQTNTKVIERCLLMTTDPGDLVLDPTCGSGTTAYVAEQWGRRWITIDTSRVALALARARIMGARYPYYLLADSRDGQRKEAEITKSLPSEQPTHGDIRHGFVYERVPHITLKSIANNAEIDVIWEQSQKTLEPLREKLNAALGTAWQEWEIPRQLDRQTSQTSPKSQTRPTAAALALHAQWWEARIARQKEIDASIAAKAENEYLYDKPYDDRSKVRVAGPLTVESISPHRVLAVDEKDNVIDGWKVSEGPGKYGVAGTPDFAAVILDNLRTSGVQQAHKEDKIVFTSLTGWPGNYICAEGRYESCPTGPTRPTRPTAPAVMRAGILIGPEFGTVSRPDLVAAAREAADAGFDVLIACAFNYDAHSAEFEKLGKIPVLKARMNPDLHMADELKNTGSGNLFVIFGEPDIEIEEVGQVGQVRQVRVRVKGVDVFKPQTGEVVTDGPDGIACWFIDTDYNEESFFVRHAYFLGANDPYRALKTTLKAEIDEAAWESLHSEVSRPFPKPSTGRIAVKVINHLGDEVMKVFAVE
ncbi:MAG: site-specific DNA-methyltransferase [Verrucomicrobia bacterium]|nr:site-specific DNA-methyltransferase [Verrucomicrobiota bacterium]